MQQRFANGQRQTGIATRHRMADPVAFGCVEKQHLVGLGDSLILMAAGGGLRGALDAMLSDKSIYRSPQDYKFGKDYIFTAYPKR